MGYEILRLSLHYLNYDTYYKCNIECIFTQEFQMINGVVEFENKATTREFRHAIRGTWNATKKNKAAIELQYGKSITQMCKEFAETGVKPTHPAYDHNAVHKI